MKNSRILYILCFVFFFMVSCEKDEIDVPKYRTLMVYLAGNNNLAGSLRNNIRDMMKGWSKSYDGNIVIFYEGSGSTGSQLLTFEWKKGVATELVLRTYDGLSSSSPATLKQAIQDMQALYPAESYGMIFGSHASGWLTPALEGHAGRSMNLSETPLTRSFAASMDVRDMAAAVPDGMDFIVFDACLMSSIETLYEFRNKAKYIVACPTETPAEGFPYSRMMSYFWKKDNKLVEGLEDICEVYYEYFNSGIANQFGSIALINTAELDNLYDLTSQILRGRADDAGKIGGNDVYFYPKVEQYYIYDLFFDLKDYIRHMSPSMVDSYQKQLEKVVLYKAVTNPFYRTTIPEEKFSGISTYIPRSFWYSETKVYWDFPWAGVYERDATE